MNINTITLGTVSSAIKTRRLLARNKIKTEIIKISKVKSGADCNYGIQFAEEDFFDIVVLLRENGIKYFVESKL